MVRGCELVLRPENRGEYLTYDPADQGAEWKKFWFHVGNFESPLLERTAGAPQVQESWSSRGPGGKQVEAILRAIAIIKKKRSHWRSCGLLIYQSPDAASPAAKTSCFRYEGTQDPTRMSSEPLAQSEVIKRCCKVLHNFDKSLTLQHSS